MPPFVYDRYLPSLADEVTENRVEELRRTLSNKRDDWLKTSDKQFSYTIVTYCHCPRGFNTGPNRVTFDFSGAKSVFYEGDGPANPNPFRGQDDEILDDSIVEVFDKVSELLDRAEWFHDNKDNNPLKFDYPFDFPLLRLEFHPQYGFPTLIAWDEPYVVDEEWVLTVSNYESVE